MLARARLTPAVALHILGDVLLGAIVTLSTHAVSAVWGSMSRIGATMTVHIVAPMTVRSKVFISKFKTVALVIDVTTDHFFVDASLFLGSSLLLGSLLLGRTQALNDVHLGLLDNRIRIVGHGGVKYELFGFGGGGLYYIIVCDCVCVRKKIKYNK